MVGLRVDIVTVCVHQRKFNNLAEHSVFFLSLYFPLANTDCYYACVCVTGVILPYTQSTRYLAYL